MTGSGKENAETIPANNPTARAKRLIVGTAMIAAASLLRGLCRKLLKSFSWVLEPKGAPSRQKDRNDALSGIAGFLRKWFPESSNNEARRHRRLRGSR